MYAYHSTDHGRTWEDLGVVLQARQATTACDSTNKYVIGGDGAFRVMRNSLRDARIEIVHHILPFKTSSHTLSS